MRLRGKVAACTAAAMLLAAPAAIADEEIVGATPNRYSNPDVTIDQGERLTFRNTDLAMHDVTSDAAGLFASETIGQGATSFVEGSQYLTTGAYGFYCSVHPQMKGTITVTSAGTPTPRPGTGTGTPPAPEPLHATLEPRNARASKLKRGGELKVDIGTNKASTLELLVSLKNKRAARAKVTFTTAGTRRVALVIKRKLRAKLRKGTRLDLQVNASDGASGFTATASLKLR